MLQIKNFSFKEIWLLKCNEIAYMLKEMMVGGDNMIMLLRNKFDIYVHQTQKYFRFLQQFSYG